MSGEINSKNKVAMHLPLLFGQEAKRIAAAEQLLAEKKNHSIIRLVMHSPIRSFGGCAESDLQFVVYSITVLDGVLCYEARVSFLSLSVGHSNQMILSIPMTVIVCKVTLLY